VERRRGTASSSGRQRKGEEGRLSHDLGELRGSIVDCRAQRRKPESISTGGSLERRQEGGRLYSRTQVLFFYSITLCTKTPTNFTFTQGNVLSENRLDPPATHRRQTDISVVVRSTSSSFGPSPSSSSPCLVLTMSCRSSPKISSDGLVTMNSRVHRRVEEGLLTFRRRRREEGSRRRRRNEEEGVVDRTTTTRRARSESEAWSDIGMAVGKGRRWRWRWTQSWRPSQRSRGWMQSNRRKGGRRRERWRTERKGRTRLLS